MKKFLLNKLLIILPIIFVIVGIIIRLKLLFYNNSFWLDECLLASNLDSNYLEFFHMPLKNVQVCPPLFLAITKFIMNITNSFVNIDSKDIVLRLFPCICGIISLPLFLYLTDKIFKSPYLNCFSSFILAFNPITIEFTIQYKQYSCELMVALILLIIFYSIKAEDITKKQIILLTIIIALCPWLSISSFFIITAGFIYFLYEAIKTKKYQILIIFISLFINFILYYFLFYKPSINNTLQVMYNFWETLYPSFFNKENFLQLYTINIYQQINMVKQEYLEFEFINGINITKQFIVLCLTLANIGILLYSKNIKNIILIISPIILTMIACYLKFYPFSQRLILFLFPCIVILYYQFLILIKNKLFSTILLSTLLILYSTNIKPIENYITPNDTRCLYKILIIHNPKLKNIISDNVIYPYYSKKMPLFIQYDFDMFDIQESINYIENSEDKDFWLFYLISNEKYYKKMTNYLTQKDKIKIIELYPSKYNYKMFLAHIEKQ